MRRVIVIVTSGLMKEERYEGLQLSPTTNQVPQSVAVYAFNEINNTKLKKIKD